MHENEAPINIVQRQDPGRQGNQEWQPWKNRDESQGRIMPPQFQIPWFYWRTRPATLVKLERTVLSLFFDTSIWLAIVVICLQCACIWLISMWGGVWGIWNTLLLNCAWAMCNLGSHPIHLSVAPFGLYICTLCNLLGACRLNCI